MKKEEKKQAEKIMTGFDILGQLTSAELVRDIIGKHHLLDADNWSQGNL